MLYPIFLNLTGKPVIVVGGGEVAERRVLSLVSCGARVTVIAPEVTPRVTSLADMHTIVLHRRRYSPGDCTAAFAVFCATDDPKLNQSVWEEARNAGALVNTADDLDRCDFVVPAVVQRGDLTMAISTNGKSPALAARLRRRLSQLIGPEYRELLDLVGEVRPEIRSRITGVQRRKELHYKIFESGVLHLLRKGNRAGARQRIRQLIEDSVQKEQP